MIVYTDTVDDIDASQLTGFFVNWGWPAHPTPETHLWLLQNSAEVVLAIDDETTQIVGYITAISDGVLSAYIPLLEVLQPYQGRNIGSDLVRRMLDKLQHVYMIDLLCDAGVQPFYERLGMQPAAGMLIRNYNQQTGTG
ncbi:GNAT family N-acetyltransferase [soil metagenome]